MKKLFTLAMLFAASATAFVSCSKDETTDVKPGLELSGKMKTITVNSAISTRTELDGHDLKWSEGDTYSIFFGTADGEFIEYAVSPAYTEGVDSYELSVPEEAEYLYCVYPATDSHASEKDLTAISAKLPSWENNEEIYKFEGTQHLMAAKAEIAENNTATVTFSPLVSILEFNIYDTKGVSKDYILKGLRVETDTNCSGAGTIDFTADDLTFDVTNGASYVTVGPNYWRETVEIPASKEEGVKVYVLVAKGEYNSFDVQIDTVDPETMFGFDADEKAYNFEFGNVAFSKFGHTINIDLAKQPINLIDNVELTQRGPWVAYLEVTPKDNCEKYVVAAFPTTSSTTSEGDQMNDGWDVNESHFAEIAEVCFDTYNSGFGLLQYMVYTGEQTVYQDYFVYNGYSNGNVWNEPQGLRISDDVEEYTIAIYAVDASGNAQVVTKTFKPVACTQGSSAGPQIAEVNNTFAGGTASVTATDSDAAYLFYGTSTTGAPTFEEIKTMFKDGEGTFVANPKSAINVDFTRYNSETVYVWAVEVGYLGGISKITSKEFAPAEMSYDGSAKVTAFNGLTFTKGMEDQENGDGEPVPCLWGYMDATITLSSDVAKFAIFDLDDTTWNLDSGNGSTYGSRYTIANIKEELAGRILAGKGENDNVFTATNTEMTIKLFYNNYNVKHHMYALAYGTDGNFGSLINLSSFEMPESAGDEAFLSSDSAYEFKGTVYDYGKGGDSEEPGDNTDLWTSWSTPNFDMMPSMGNLYVYDDSGATKLWVIKLDKVNADDIYGWNNTLKTECRNKIGSLFKNYANDKTLSSDANVLTTFEGSSIPKSESKGTFSIDSTDWAKGWTEGEIFALVAEYDENVFGAAIRGLDVDGDWINLGVVNANNKPE